MPAVATSVKLSAETSAKLEALAQRTGRSKSFYLRQAIDTHIDQLMWEYGVLQVAEDVRTGIEPTYSASEVDEILGLDA